VILGPSEREKRKKALTKNELPPPTTREAESVRRNFLRDFGYDLSETQVVLLLSYLYPGAVFSASFVVFMTNHHLLSFIVA
jgi:hypothetical protein